MKRRSLNPAIHIDAARRGIYLGGLWGRRGGSPAAAALAAGVQACTPRGPPVDNAALRQEKPP